MPSLSPYADRTLEEYRAIFPESHPGNSSRSATAPAEPPSYPFTAFSDAYVAKAKEAGIDWREKGVVTPCKSQGPHGVCGTFGQTQDAESSRAIGGGGANPNKRPHTAVQFSEQQVKLCACVCVCVCVYLRARVCVCMRLPPTNFPLSDLMCYSTAVGVLVVL